VCSVPLRAKQPVHLDVSLIAAYKAGLAKHALAPETTLLQRLLLGRVLCPGKGTECGDNEVVRILLQEAVLLPSLPE
jgi:hypothetical protein